MRSAVVLAILLAASLASAKPVDDVNALVDAQIKTWSKEGIDDQQELYTNGAHFAVTGGFGDDDMPDAAASQLSAYVINAPYSVVEHKLSDRAVGVSRDGKTAWVSFGIWLKIDTSTYGNKDSVERSYRATEIAVATKDGWKLAGGTWSTAQPNDKVNKDARAGKRKLAELPKASDSKALLDAFTAMLSTTPPTTKDLVAFGSASGERTVGGALFMKGWDGTWRGHVAVIGGPIVRVAPSGTSGSVIANLALTKQAGGATYAIPFRVLFVFDQSDGGAWTIAHAHFAVAPR